MSWKKGLVGLLALLTLPILPVVFIWYLNIGGIYGVIRERRKQSAAAEAVAGERRDEKAPVGAKQ